MFLLNKKTPQTTQLTVQLTLLFPKLSTPSCGFPLHMVLLRCHVDVSAVITTVVIITLSAEEGHEMGPKALLDNVYLDFLINLILKF